MRYHTGKHNVRKRNCMIKIKVSTDEKGDSSGTDRGGREVRSYQNVQATEE